MVNRTLGIPFEFNLRFPILEYYLEKCFYAPLFKLNGHIFAVAICSVDCWGSAEKGVAERVFWVRGKQGYT